MDVRTLINDWEIIRSTIPSQDLSEEMPLGHRHVGEIAYMSRRKERWEVFVCLMSFQKIEKKDPNKILSELEEYVFQKRPSELVSSFLQYSSEYVMVTHEQFLSEAVRLRRDLGNKRIMILSSTLDALQECRAKHEPDWNEVWRCVREAGGGANAKARVKSAKA